MRTVLLSLTIAALSLGLVQGAFAQAPAATGTATATAEIVANLTIVNTASLNFGQIVPGTAIGTVTISPAGVLSSSGAVAPVSSATRSAAAFTVTGMTDATYAITVQATPATITSGANSMTVQDFVASKPAGVLAPTTDTFTVGGTLNVGAGQAVGVYSGQFSVDVAYN